MVKIFRLSFPLSFILQPTTSLYCVVTSTEVGFNDFAMYISMPRLFSVEL